MQGVRVFKSVTEALKAGFHVYDRSEAGFLVRMRTSAGWALAIAKGAD